MTAAIPLGFRPHLDGYYDVSFQLQRHVYRRSEALFEQGERYKDRLVTAAQVYAWQEQVRARTLAAIGGMPPSDTPLNPEERGTVQGDGFVVEKVIYQSMPEVFVTANLYLPANLTQPTGAVLFACGHAEAAKAHPTYQAVCQRLARNGLVVLALDPYGQGERKSYLDGSGREDVRWGTAEHTYAGYQCWWLGHSIIRYFVQDARRAIDYLCQRPEVDAARIGMTGSSGGGTQTAWMMLLESRLAAVAPATSLSRRRDYMWTGQAQDAEQHLPGGTAAGIDHEDCLIVMAPRPALVLAADYDFFNIEGAVATVERARRVYGVLGTEQNLELVRATCTHQFHPQLAQAATAFFVQHLLGRDRASVDHSEPHPFDAGALQCTDSGQVLLDRPGTRRVFDLNLAEYRARRAPHSGAERAETARRRLEDLVQRGRRPAREFFPRWLPGPPADGVSVLHGFWWSEEDVLNAGVLLRPATDRFASLVIALFDQGTVDLEQRRDWCLQRVRAGQAVLALDVRGTGVLTPRDVLTSHSPLHNTRYKLACDLLWLDDSLPAMAVYDVLRAIEFVRADSELQLGERPIHLFGTGRGAFRGYLAAALDPTVIALELEAPVPDLDEMMTQRLYARPEQLEMLPDYLFPGLLESFDWRDVAPLVAGRLTSAEVMR